MFACFAAPCPCSTALTFAAARVDIPERVHSVADAICGTITAFGRSFRPGFICGSSSNTSRPAKKCGLRRQCSTSAASSITGPRAQLTKIASRFMMFSRSSLMRWNVVLSRFGCRVTTSARLRTSSTESSRCHSIGSSSFSRNAARNVSSFASNALFWYLSKYTTFMCAPRAIIRPTAAPMRPAPMTPSVFPCKSLPMKRSGSQILYFSARMNASASTIRRAHEYMRDTAISAVASVSTPGVFPTATPCLVAAPTSTLSKPTAMVENARPPALLSAPKSSSFHCSVSCPMTASQREPIALRIALTGSASREEHTSTRQSRCVSSSIHSGPTICFVTTTRKRPSGL
mmetsp:Transcript_6403/g.17146  ORF Transcript_6403/g.17146 Transcript_6403/m.17146 type:complete len:345 (-) Transcript_6403:75-1109(-)